MKSATLSRLDLRRRLIHQGLGERGRQDIQRRVRVVETFSSGLTRPKDKH